MSILTEAAVNFTLIADALPKMDSSLYLTFVLLIEARSALTVTPMATLFITFPPGGLGGGDGGGGDGAGKTVS